jgi:hypothetical protein
MTMAFTPYTFTDAQLVDIRRFCGYPVYGSGAVVFPAPWTMKQYMALEYKLQNINTDEANVVINTYLTNLTMLESAIPAAGANLDTESAAVWKHNKDELRDRESLFDGWRMRLCQFLGVPPGPNFVAPSGCMVV